MLDDGITADVVNEDFKTGAGFPAKQMNILLSDTVINARVSNQNFNDRQQMWNGLMLTNASEGWLSRSGPYDAPDARGAGALLGSPIAHQLNDLNSSVGSMAHLIRQLLEAWGAQKNGS